MASVFLGRAKSEDGDETPEKVVALKLVRQEFAEKAEFNDMFLDEAKILAQLAHPNIIETLEIGVTEGHRFIAMELLLGRTLADVWETRALAKQAMPIHLACWSVARVAEALHYAHDFSDLQGRPLHIIHRDVNPSNIFVTYDGKVKLIDFGLVKAIGRVAKSAEGVVKGKVPYLSPEQITEASIDRRSDIYTLGITLWEMTTGMRLFKRESDAATIRAIQKAEVPDPRRDNPSYPDALWTIVQKALAVRREDRYADAGDFAKALNEFLAERKATDLEPKLAKFMTETFPGEQDRQHAWLAKATTKERSSPNVTIPPPIPLPDVAAAEALRISQEMTPVKDVKISEHVRLSQEVTPVREIIVVDKHGSIDEITGAVKTSEKKSAGKKAETANEKKVPEVTASDANAPIVPARVFYAGAMLAFLFLIYELFTRA
jgi:serine/threonine protein kinase